MTWVILGVPPPSWSPQSLGTPEVCGWTSSQRLGGGHRGYQGPFFDPRMPPSCQAVGDKLLDVYMPMPFATQPDISAANIGTFGRCCWGPRSRSMSKHGVLTNPGLCMALPSLSFLLHLVIVSCFGGDLPATSAGLVHSGLCTPEAPDWSAGGEISSIDREALEQGTVGTRSMDLWTSQGLDPQIREFSSQFLKCHPYNLLGHRFGPTEPMKLTARWMSGSRQWRPARAARCTTPGSTMWCTRWKPCQSAGAKLSFGNSLGSCGGLQNTNLHRSAYTSSSFKLGAIPKSHFNIVYINNDDQSWSQWSIMIIMINHYQSRS